MNLSLPLFDLPDPPRPGPPAAMAPPARLDDGAGHALAAEPAAASGPDAGVGQPLDLLALHPALWRASQMGQGRRRTRPSGFEVLDAQLPGGGWPHGELTELLLPQAGMGELRLLAPALAVGSAQAEAGRHCVMLFDPPARLSAWALAQQGLDTGGWVVVQPRERQRHPRQRSGLTPLLPGADVLWALEQALRSGHVDAVLAWLPMALRADALRRLQLAAQAHDGPVFMFREAAAASRASPAPLRLLLQPAGVDGLSLRLLKRRGPPLAQPLRLQLPPVLTPRQQAQAVSRQAIAAAGAAAGAAASAGAHGVVGLADWAQAERLSTPIGRG